MRGPFERLKYDLRRIWECPVCKRRDRTTGEVTTLFCRCNTADANALGNCMQLVEADGIRTVPPIVLIHEPLPPRVAPAVEAELDVEPTRTAVADPLPPQAPENPAAPQDN